MVNQTSTEGILSPQHPAAAVGSEAVVRGRPLELRRDPPNPHDAKAFGVLAAGGGVQVGWVPR